MPDTASKVHGFIDYTNAAQQTQIAHIVIPRNYRGVLLDVQGSIKSAQGTTRSVSFGVEVAELADEATVASPLWTPRRRVLEMNLVSSATSRDSKKARVPFGVFGELTRVGIRATASSTSNVAASFDMVLLPRTE